MPPRQPLAVPTGLAPSATKDKAKPHAASLLSRYGRAGLGLVNSVSLPPLPRWKTTAAQRRVRDACASMAQDSDLSHGRAPGRLSAPVLSKELVEAVVVLYPCAPADVSLGSDLEEAVVYAWGDGLITSTTVLRRKLSVPWLPPGTPGRVVKVSSKLVGATQPYQLQPQAVLEAHTSLLSQGLDQLWLSRGPQGRVQCTDVLLNYATLLADYGDRPQALVVRAAQLLLGWLAELYLTARDPERVDSETKLSFRSGFDVADCELELRECRTKLSWWFYSPTPDHLALVELLCSRLPNAGLRLSDCNPYRVASWPDYATLEPCCVSSRAGLLPTRGAPHFRSWEHLWVTTTAVLARLGLSRQLEAALSTVAQAFSFGGTGRLVLPPVSLSRSLFSAALAADQPLGTTSDAAAGWLPVVRSLPGAVCWLRATLDDLVFCARETWKLEHVVEVSLHPQHQYEPLPAGEPARESPLLTRAVTSLYSPLKVEGVTGAAFWATTGHHRWHLLATREPWGISALQGDTTFSGTLKPRDYWRLLSAAALLGTNFSLTSPAEEPTDWPSLPALPTEEALQAWLFAQREEPLPLSSPVRLSHKGVELRWVEAPPGSLAPRTLLRLPKPQVSQLARALNSVPFVPQQLKLASDPQGDYRSQRLPSSSSSSSCSTPAESPPLPESPRGSLTPRGDSLQQLRPPGRAAPELCPQPAQVLGPVAGVPHPVAAAAQSASKPSLTAAAVAKAHPADPVAVQAGYSAIYGALKTSGYKQFSELDLSPLRPVLDLVALFNKQHTPEGRVEHRRRLCELLPSATTDTLSGILSPLGHTHSTLWYTGLWHGVQLHKPPGGDWLTLAFYARPQEELLLSLLAQPDLVSTLLAAWRGGVVVFGEQHKCYSAFDWYKVPHRLNSEQAFLHFLTVANDGHLPCRQVTLVNQRPCPQLYLPPTSHVGELDLTELQLNLSRAADTATTWPVPCAGSATKGLDTWAAALGSSSGLLTASRLQWFWLAAKECLPPAYCTGSTLDYTKCLTALYSHGCASLYEHNTLELVSEWKVLDVGSGSSGSHCALASLAAGVRLKLGHQLCTKYKLPFASVLSDPVTYPSVAQEAVDATVRAVAEQLGVGEDSLANLEVAHVALTGPLLFGVSARVWAHSTTRGFLQCLAYSKAHRQGGSTDPTTLELLYLPAQHKDGVGHYCCLVPKDRRYGTQLEWDPALAPVPLSGSHKGGKGQARTKRPARRPRQAWLTPASPLARRLDAWLAQQGVPDCGARAALTLWVMSAPVGQRRAREALLPILQAAARTTSLSGWQDTYICEAKKVHEATRKAWVTGELNDPDEVASFHYLHALVGRLGRSPDWSVERAKRRLTTGAPGPDLETLEAALGEPLRQWVVHTLRDVRSWRQPSVRQYAEERWARVAAGTASGVARPRAACPTKGLKRTALESLTLEEVCQLVREGGAEQRARAHPKMQELAKARAIYGVELGHYLAADYLVSTLERHTRAPGAALHVTQADQLSRAAQLVELAEEGYAFSSFDFEDFNSQHTCETMRQLLLGLTDVVLAHTLEEDREDVLAIGNLVADSHLHQVAEYPDGVVAPAELGLFSGSRLTTTVNTLLNLAYTTAGLRAAGLEHTVIHSLHYGDDYVGVFRNLDDVHAAHAAFLRLGVRAQPDKQLAGVGRFEYLRELYWPSGLVLGSLCRSLASAVFGNWEAGPHAAVASASQAHERVLATLALRGATQRGLDELHTMYQHDEACREAYAREWEWEPELLSSLVGSNASRDLAATVALRLGDPGLVGPLTGALHATSVASEAGVPARLQGPERSRRCLAARLQAPRYRLTRALGRALSAVESVSLRQRRFQWLFGLEEVILRLAPHSLPQGKAEWLALAQSQLRPVTEHDYSLHATLHRFCERHRLPAELLDSLGTDLGLRS
uniref:RNA-directed RNA polymerase n=1 Tax=Riboviria sp. TaxID=2585031 RepID=A0A8F5DVJ3_9VIRU|nr:putative RdRp [Riboviria sp.]